MTIRAKLGTGPAMNYHVLYKRNMPAIGERIRIASTLHNDRPTDVRVTDIVSLEEGTLYLLEFA